MGDIEGDETRVAITYENLQRCGKKRQNLIDDGLINWRLRILKNGDVVCRPQMAASLRA